MIPFADFKAQYASLEPEIRAAVDEVLTSGWYILGPQVTAFEHEFGTYQGVSHVLGVASGTEAIQLALMALEIGPGDEVIVPANTCVPTVCGIVATGARPIVADVTEETLTLDPRSVETRITRATRAVVPVHLYGHPCDMDPILALARDRGLAVVEDCAQAHGALYKGRKCGTLGDAAAFSFYPTKNLGAYGDGGAVVTNDGDVAERVRRMRNYGEERRYHHTELGINSRLDEIQAAILRVKLRHLDHWNARRKLWAEKYLHDISSPVIELPPHASWALHAWHLFVVRTQGRDALQEHLRNAGVQTLIHYPIPIHLQEAHRGRVGASAGDLPVAEKACATVLSLPLYPELPECAIERITQAVHEFRP